MKKKSASHSAFITFVVILAAVALQGCDIVDVIKGLAPDVQLSQICYTGNMSTIWVAFKNNSSIVDLKNAKVGVACMAYDDSGSKAGVTYMVSVMNLGKGLGTAVKLNSTNLIFPNSSLFVPELWLDCWVEYNYQGLADPLPSNNKGEIQIYPNMNSCFTPSAPQSHNGGWLPPPPSLPQPSEVLPAEQPQPEQPQSAQSQPEQLQPIQPLPAQPQPEQLQPAQPQPEQLQPIQPLPAQPQPEQLQPAQSEPAQPQPSTSGQSSQSGCGGAPLIPYFNANPASIFSSQSTTLSWGNITNGKTGPLVRSAKIDPGLGEVGSGASSRTVKPTKTTTYTLTATGCGGTATKQVPVTVFH